MIPGGLLRFDILVNVTSDVNPHAKNHLLALKVRHSYYGRIAIALVSWQSMVQSVLGGVWAWHRLARTALQGIIQQAPTNWTQYEPVLVTQLPYSVKYPIQSPSGKAVFQIRNKAHTGNSTLYVDLVVCRFPEPGNLKIPDGTVTAYRCYSLPVYPLRAESVADCSKTVRCQ